MKLCYLKLRGVCSKMILQLQSEFKDFSFPFGSTNVECTLLNTSETVHTALGFIGL